MTPERLEFERRLSHDNFGIVVSQALNFPQNIVCDTEDYIQVGAIALIKAIRSYKPDKGTKWSTYATICVKRAISHECFKFKHKMSAPSEINTRYNKILYLLRQGKTKSEICTEINISESRYDRIIDLFNQVYLETKNIVDDYEDPMIAFKDIVDGLVNNVEINLLRLRLKGHTFAEIGAQYNKSTEWARRKINRLTKKIRTYYEETDSVV